MTTKSLALLALLSVVSAGSAGAQLRSPGRPASERLALSAELPLVVLPAPDVARLRAEDEADLQAAALGIGTPKPYRYGAIQPVELGPDTHGRWDEAEGTLVWRLELRSPGALSLGVLFDRFDLPAGGELFLYDPARRELLGAYTEANEDASGALQVQPLAGDALVIEYVQPVGVAGAPQLRIGHVVHDYRGLLQHLLAGPSSASAASCLVDVNCPQGNNWQDVKRSVIMIVGGGGLCSAGLLNNTANDGTPYFLTADHCGDFTNVVAYFNYELSGCGSGTYSQSQTLSGATLLGMSGLYDSQLYLLSQTPPRAYQPFYAGWRRNKNAPGPAVSISHPSGLPKKLARDDDDPYASGNFWTLQWEVGTLEPGSSGSPVFDAEKRVLGPTCCVSGFSCNNQLTNYGRFGLFWTARNLGTYLDPLGTGVVELDGFDPFAATATVYNGSGLNPVILSSTTPPALGSTWMADVDTSAYPSATSTYLLGHAGQSAGTLFPFGELLLDLSSPFVFSHAAVVSGGMSTHSIALPNNPSLAGLQSYAQAAVLGVTPAVATNGLAIVVN
jgi:hypothetical protein